jgi:hypothetical protein
MIYANKLKVMAAAFATAALGAPSATGENLRDNTAAMVLSYECALHHVKSPVNGRDMSAFCWTVKQEYEFLTTWAAADGAAFFDKFYEKLYRHPNFEYLSRLEGYECGINQKAIITLPGYCPIVDGIHDEAIRTHWNSVLQTPDHNE